MNAQCPMRGQVATACYIAMLLAVTSTRSVYAQIFSARSAIHTQSKQAGVSEAYSDLRLFLPAGDLSLMHFLDARMLVDSNGFTQGGNLGFGLRGHLDRADAIWGANLFVDHRRTDVANFHQIGFGFESLFAAVELRSNFYFPIGNRKGISAAAPSGVSSGNQDLLVFSDNYLIFGSIFDQQRRVERSLRGFDAEVGANLVKDILPGVTSKTHIGIYGFENPGLEDIVGISTRWNANAWDSIDLNIGVQSDRFFGTQATIGLTLFIEKRRGYSSRCCRETVVDRMNDPVTRRSAITVAETKIGADPVFVGERLRYASNGDEIRVVHVDSASTGGDGTFENPLGDVGQVNANSEIGDIVYLYSGSVFDGQNSLLLQDGQHLLGEGGGYQHMLDTLQAGVVALPNVRGISGDIPVIQNSTATAIELANRTLVANLSVVDPLSGAGISGTDVSDAIIKDSSISTTAQGVYGVSLSGASSLSLENSDVSTSGRVAYGVALNDSSSLHSVESQITTNGQSAHGLIALNQSEAWIDQGSVITANGPFAYGVFAMDQSMTRLDNASEVRTNGMLGYGFRIKDEAEVIVDHGSSIHTTAIYANGATVLDFALFTLQGGSQIHTEGDIAYGIYTSNNGQSTVTGASSILTEGMNSHGVHTQSDAWVSISEQSSVHTTGATAYGMRFDGRSGGDIVNSSILSDTDDEIYGIADRDNNGLQLSILNNVLDAGNGTIHLFNRNTLNGSTITVTGVKDKTELATANGIDGANVTDGNDVIYQE
ncbi:hypothetical protein K227x_00890 [Rubripirellula lacrimiformis]|uniref:Inverse autotransporter beta-domain domain-containing protein n=1 Tax=Rubripirellula lacrimiformis TaxID=1930273 RepID=A0A517N3L5_9BACT|nr:inverse autotransporter beta domain-containing protein [Rubripirellula lacrimiformis]QDT01722.1 hypothetical protein K227x_00890 [Rubripirellula lacrimiformis]